MAFVAGYSNGVTLSGYLDDVAPVAGVTNLITKTAIAVGSGDRSDLNAGILFSAMLGAFISGLMNPRPVAFVLTPRYGPTFLIGSAFSALGAVQVIYNHRREFYFLAIANGVMNGITSMYSSNLLRVSAFSGPVTDIGVCFGQLVRGNRSNAWKLYVLVGLFLSFWLGGLVGYEAAIGRREMALFFNAVFFFAMGFALVAYFVIKRKLTLFEALFGLGKVGIRFKRMEVRRQGVDERGEPIENKTEPVSEKELLELYDSLLEREGEVNEDALMSLLASRDLEVKKHRRSILGIIQHKMAQHDQEGDWTIGRDDWENLVSNANELPFTNMSGIASSSMIGSINAVAPPPDMFGSTVGMSSAIGGTRAGQPGIKESLNASINATHSAARNKKATFKESMKASVHAIRLASIMQVESTGWVVDEGEGDAEEEREGS
ncbi:hypothetical protein ACHAWF_005507 [Thalassiosira exigua]